MISAGIERRAIDGRLTRCAVFKIDLKGRFVYLDDLAEDLLQSPKECLFGRSVKGYLTEESYNTMMAILMRARHYETFFEAIDLELVDSVKNTHPLRGIISLNFVAGNPSNYQIVLIPSSREEFFRASGRDLGSRLFDFVSGIEKEFDWGKLAEVFLEYADSSQVGIYDYRDGAMKLLGSSAAQGVPGGSDLPATSNIHMNIITTQQAALVQSKDEGGQTREACFPLICGEACWGVVRLIYPDEIAELDEAIDKACRVIGKALFMFV